MPKLLVALLLSVFASSSLAMPTDEVIEKINTHIVKVQVALANGGYGVGSGVVVAKDQVVTNCHVIAKAQSIGVISQGEGYSASAIKTDWHHDVCILKVEGLRAPAVNIGSSNALQYEQPIYSVGFPNNSPNSISTFGVVKGLYPMDDSVIVRTSSAFRMGASGGGVFDAMGNLVAIITLKSPGRNAFYYNMSVEWVKALLDAPEQAIFAANNEHPSPFWDAPQDKWPFFMRVVHPLQTEDWNALLAIASEWTAKEPNANEAWYYQAVAEHGLNQHQQAEQHFAQVIANNHLHTDALYFTALIAEKTGKHIEALNSLALLKQLDDETAGKLMIAMGVASAIAE